MEIQPGKVTFEVKARIFHERIIVAFSRKVTLPGWIAMAAAVKWSPMVERLFGSSTRSGKARRKQAVLSGEEEARQGRDSRGEEASGEEDEAREGA